MSKVLYILNVCPVLAPTIFPQILLILWWFSPMLYLRPHHVRVHQSGYDVQLEVQFILSPFRFEIPKDHGFTEDQPMTHTLQRNSRGVKTPHDHTHTHKKIGQADSCSGIMACPYPPYDPGLVELVYNPAYGMTGCTGLVLKTILDYQFVQVIQGYRRVLRKCGLNHARYCVTFCHVLALAPTTI